MVEPPHVHVQRDRAVAKFWLTPVRLARSYGFTKRDLHLVRQLIEAKESVLLEAWNEWFGQ
jgi:uncharacterized protein DUF4160